MSERTSLDAIYPPEIIKTFPTFEKEVASFLEKNSGVIANLATPATQIEKYAQNLRALANVVASGIKNREIDISELYLKVTNPTRKVNSLPPEIKDRVGIIPGIHRYHKLEKDAIPDSGISLILLLQRVPKLVDTVTEVHGLRKEGGQLIPDKTAGIEVYIPLVDGITFYVNKDDFQPKALGGLVTILPGDSHHHIKTEGQGPARVLILGGFGFGYGVKTENNFQVPEFSNISRFTPIN